jgi:hypothetical protein
MPDDTPANLPPAPDPALMALPLAEINRRLAGAISRGEDWEVIARLRMAQVAKGMKGPGTPYVHLRPRKARE